MVAQGFTQRPGIDFIETFAPVARLESLRLLMALSVKLNWKIHQLNVETAYLNGDINTEVHKRLPTLLSQMLNRIIMTESNLSLLHLTNKMLRSLKSGNTICRLKKTLYGLRQTGRQWHRKLDDALKSLNLTSTNYDPCMYIGKKENQIYVLVHVDDLVIASNDKRQIEEIKNGLSQRFK